MFLVEVQKIAMMPKFLSSQPVFAVTCYTRTIFNLQIVSLTQYILVKLGTFVQWSFLVIPNKSARIYFNIFGDTVIYILKSGKTGGSVLVPMLRQEKHGLFHSISYPTKSFIFYKSLLVFQNKARIADSL